MLLFTMRLPPAEQMSPSLCKSLLFKTPLCLHTYLHPRFLFQVKAAQSGWAVQVTWHASLYSWPSPTLQIFDPLSLHLLPSTSIHSCVIAVSVNVLKCMHAGLYARCLATRVFFSVNGPLKSLLGAA